VAETATRMKLEAQWDDFKGRVKETWGDITDDEIQQVKGRWDQVVAVIKQKTGESMEAIEQKLEDLVETDDQS
jgi:uncharacterized protein YjbJ (UPF0337 family)